MGRNILLGFAGPGKVSHTNVKDLLGDYLGLGPEDKNGLPAIPDDVDEIRVVIPAGDEFLTPTVSLLWEWTDAYAEFPYEAFYDHETRKNRRILDNAEQAIEARNVVAAMIDRLVEGQKNGDEVALIVSWGEEGDDRTEMLVDLALAKDLPVKAIDQGLDDLSFGEDPEPEPEEKPTRRGRRTAKTEDTAEDTAAPAEEPARPRRGKPRKTAETSPEPAEAAETESVEEEVSLARRRVHRDVEATPVEDVVLSALQDARRLVRSLDACHAAMSGRAEPVPSPLYRLLEEAIETYRPKRDPGPKSDEESAEKRSGGRPRKDGTPARTRSPQARGVKEWLNEDGEWVKAGRGRLPKDVRTRTVDPKTGDVLSED